MPTLCHQCNAIKLHHYSSQYSTAHDRQTGENLSPTAPPWTTYLVKVLFLACH